jgi:TatA/E family protein of Tat protein translocase
LAIVRTGKGGSISQVIYNYKLTLPGRGRLDNDRWVSYHPDERYFLFSGGFTEIGFILFIAFLLFGPKKLPEIARTLGKGLAEFRRASNELKFSLEEEIRNLDREDKFDYSQPETQHYVGTNEETRALPEETTHELSHPEGDLEPASEYGYDYSKSSEHEPEPRT